MSIELFGKIYKDWEEAKAEIRRWQQFMPKMCGRNAINNTVDNLIQVADAEIGLAYTKLVQCKADKNNLKQEIEHLKARIKELKNG